MFDPAADTAADLVEAIEDCGFGATLLSAGAAGKRPAALQERSKSTHQVDLSAVNHGALKLSSADGGGIGYRN